MKKIIAVALFVALLLGATSVSWGGGKGNADKPAREGVTWER